MSAIHDRLAVAGVALAMSLSGCGPAPLSANVASNSGAAGPPTAQATAMPKACDVLSADLAKKYLGDGAALRRDAQPNPHMTQCQWGSDRGVITVMVGPWSLISASVEPTDKAVGGLGDEAHSNFSGLYVRKGDKGISISVIAESGDFWGKAADDEEAKTEAAQAKVAPDLVARL